MKKVTFILVAIIFAFLMACSGKTNYHKSSLPDPASFKGHFGDMDASGDDRVDWEEFKAHFSHAQPDVFKAIDLSKDNVLSHDEWHAFKEAHGLIDHD